MHARLVFAFTLLLLGNLTLPSHAQVGEWVSWGPSGGFLDTVAVDPVDPSILYLGTPGTFYRSFDRGQTWETSSRNLGTALRKIWAVPGNPTTVYVMTGDGLYRSNRRGRAWRRVFGSNSLRNLAAGTENPSLLLLTAHTGLFRSEDRGNTWQAILQDVFDDETTFSDIAADPASPETFYVVAGERQDSRLWRSLDGGLTWQETLAAPGLLNLAIGPARAPGEPGALYVNDFDLNFYRSFDGGESWNLLEGTANDLLGLMMLEADPHQSGILFSNGGRPRGLRRSTDHGTSWLLLDVQTQPISQLSFDPHQPDALFLTTGFDGLGISNDGGQSWQLTGGEIPARWISTIAPDPRAEDAVLVLADGRLRGTADAGASWSEPSGDHYPTQNRVYTLLRDPEDPDLLWTPTHDSLLRSQDGGLTWSLRDPISTGDPPLIAKIFDDPRSPGRLWLITNQGIFNYDDLEPTWTWIPMRPDDSSQAQPILDDLAVDSNDPETLWVVDNLAVFHSPDGGQTWQHREPKLGRGDFFREVVLDPQRPQRVYLLSHRRVWLSTDQGETWESWRQGLPGGRALRSLAIDPGTGALYVGLARLQGPAGGGVFRRTAHGGEWQPIGRFKDNIAELVVERRGGRALIWAGTTRRSLFRLELQR